MGLMAALLASCGGGTSQIEPFKAGRLIAFGDELSAFTADGRNFSVNGLDTAQAPDCNALPIWIQVVAKVYNFGFSQCPLPGGQALAITRAAPGAGSADLATQVAAQVADGGILDKDLVTVLVGVNDIKALYLKSLASPASPEAQLIADAQALGVEVARQVNALVDRGARVIVATVPDVGLSPYGIAQGAAGAGLLSRLSAALNGRIRANILNDGRYVGLVLGDEFTQVANRGFYGYANVTQAACTVALPDCTSATLSTGATAETWLWADDTWLTTAGHRRLGALAEARARQNPF